MDETALATKKKSAFNELSKNMPPIEVLVCEMIAAHDQPMAILARCQEAIGRGEIKKKRIYLLTGASTRPQRHSALVDWIRAKALIDSPINDPLWRYRQREQIVKDAIEQKNYTAALETLRDIDRMQGMVSETPQAPGVAVQVNVGPGKSVVDDLLGRIARLSGENGA